MKRGFICFLLFVLSLALLVVMVLFEIKAWPVGNSLAGLALGFSIPALWHSTQDLFDTANWMMAQRKLQRGKIITDNTIVRISFSYLFRIKVGNEYLLVKNERGTGKYQPVGGVYKFLGDEKNVLRNLYQIKDDDKIPIDESSRDDYRLRMENRYLRKFVRRFDTKAEREQISNLSREFKEELIEKGLLDWDQISYRFCGRHMTTLKFGEHFQTFELLLADVVELLPTKEQEADLVRLKEHPSDEYYFATAEEITALGINTKTNALKEIIADHTKKILQENEGQLMKKGNVGQRYTVNC